MFIASFSYPQPCISPLYSTPCVETTSRTICVSITMALPIAIRSLGEHHLIKKSGKTIQNTGFPLSGADNSCFIPARRCLPGRNRGPLGYSNHLVYAVSRSLSPDLRRRVRLFSKAVCTALEDPTMITRCFPRVRAVYSRLRWSRG